MKENAPLVSICCITYNHENYIRECIEGFLIQKTTFAVEIIIHDDASTDGTANIIKEYKKKHPYLIFPIYQKENQYLKKQGSIFARFVFPQACGKYIALCEGDDYWTDPMKLQKQVDFLERNPLISLVFHNAVVKYLNKEKNDHPFVSQYSKEFFKGEDVLKQWIIPTASMVFRNVLSDQIPEFLIKATHGDLALQLYLSSFGDFALINQKMSVYRLSDSSITKSRFAGIEHNLLHINQLILIKEFFKGKHSKLINKRLSKYYVSTGLQYFKKGKKKEGLKILFVAIKESPYMILLLFKDFLSFSKNYILNSRR